MTDRQRQVLTPETGAVLKTARLSRKWTLARASREIGCSESFLCRMEKAKAAPSGTVALEMAITYQLPADQARRLFRESVVGSGRDKRKRAKG